MFRVTLRHLDRAAAHAQVGLGETELGLVSPASLKVILTTFLGIDAIENNDAEPEILIENRGARYLVRMSGRRLLMHNPRQPDQPPLALSPEEIIAELDGTAAAARHASVLASAATNPPFVPAPEEPAYTPPPQIKEKPSRIMVIATAALSMVVGYQLLPAREPTATPDPAWLTEADGVESQLAALVGIYVTGNKPGAHGIALATDSLKIFQVNAVAAPSVVIDTYRIGRREGKLVLVTNQPGGDIRVVDKDTLTYCGEDFRRVP